MDIPKDFHIKEYDEALVLLEELRKQIESGEIMSVLFVAERVDDSVWGGCTSTQNVFQVAGCMLSWAISRLGFKYDPKLHQPHDEQDLG